MWWKTTHIHTHIHTHTHRFPKVELVTRSVLETHVVANNSHTYTHTHTHTQIPKVELVNPIGAGDTCGGNMLFALSEGKSPVEAFAWGLAAAR